MLTPSLATTIDPDEVDRRLADGWTLPAQLYTDPGLIPIEDERIFRPAWHVVATLADFRNQGDYVATQVGGKYPIFVTRGKDGELRAFLNVCRHRGCLVVGGERGDTLDSEGCAQRFKCRYHGWTYGLDGALVGVPDFKDAKLPPFSELGLHPISVDTWAGMVFVSIEPAESLSETLSDVVQIAEQSGYPYPFLDEEVELVGTYAVEVNANWKVYQENNLECYHCEVTHPETLGAVCKTDATNFKNQNFKNGSYIWTEFADDIERYIGDEDAKRAREIRAESNNRAFQQTWMWPTNIMASGVVLGEAIYRIDPVDVNHCRLLGRAYARPGDVDETVTRLQEWQSSVLAEDTGVSGGTQLGLASGAREWGPLLYGREEAITWFSQCVWEHLAPAFR